jgi:hypothetical protein
MSEVPPQEEPEPTIEDIEQQLTDLFNQMSAAAKKLSLLGKRIREETAPLPNTEALEQEYLSLPVSTRPSWFQFIATTEPKEAKKFAPQQALNQ